MLNVLVGAALGFLSGLGVGGGSLLLLWLSLIAGVPREQARLINLMFFLPCALMATVLRKGAPPDRRITLTAILGGAAGAVLGNFLCGTIHPDLLRKAFGVLFILTGIRELRFHRE